MRAAQIAFIALFSTCAFGKPPTVEQVNAYFAVAKIQEAVEAQAQGFRAQYAASARPEQKAQIDAYVESVIGWTAVRAEYTELVQSTFSAEEIQASLGFMKSKIGQAIAQKNALFASKSAALVAKRVQTFSEGFSSITVSDAVPTEASDQQLEIADLVRHDEQGRIYFTGRLTNKGKSAARGVQVEVNLFSGAKFVDQYSTYVIGSIPAAGERYFKVSCGCKDSAPAAHDSYRAVAVLSY